MTRDWYRDPLVHRQLYYESIGAPYQFCIEIMVIFMLLQILVLNNRL